MDPALPPHPADSTHLAGLAGLEQVIHHCLATDGALAAAVIDVDSGTVLAGRSLRSQLDIHVAGYGSSVLVQAAKSAATAIDQRGLPEVLVTLTDSFHIIAPAVADGSVYVFFGVDRHQVTHALARLRLSRALAIGLGGQ